MIVSESIKRHYEKGETYYESLKKRIEETYSAASSVDFGQTEVEDLEEI